MRGDDLGSRDGTDPPSRGDSCQGRHAAKFLYPWETYSINISGKHNAGRLPQHLPPCSADTASWAGMQRALEHVGFWHPLSWWWTCTLSIVKGVKTLVLWWWGIRAGGSFHSAEHEQISVFWCLWCCLILCALNSHKYKMGECLLRSHVFTQPLLNIISFPDKGKSARQQRSVNIGHRCLGMLLISETVVSLHIHITLTSADQNYYVHSRIFKCCFQSWNELLEPFNLQHFQFEYIEF